MRAVCFLAVLIVAKMLAIAGHPGGMSIWTLPAYFAQDVLVVVVAGTCDALLGRPRLGWVVYAAAVLYVAVNVPISRVLGSTLTPSLIRAARGPLADSIAHYLTLGNLAAIGVVLLVGVVSPIVLTRTTVRPHAVAVSLAACFGALGPLAASRVDTNGWNRNALTSLLPVSLPTVPASGAAIDWRHSPFTMATSTDLARLRTTAKGMNVLMVILESTAAQYLHPYGAVDDPMPSLTTLSGHALVFDRAYATYPESIKGLFATLCSRYPAFDEPAEAHAAAPCASIAQSLTDAGYHSALFHSGRFAYLGMDAVIQAKGFERLEDAGAIGGHVHSSFGVDEPATVARILQWIDALPAREHFFVTYLPVAGHHPYASPVAGPFSPGTDLGRYRNALHYGDQSLAVLLEGLRTRHLDDCTMVVVFGDHGEAFGQHPGNIGHTLFIDEENVRVPYLISIPGVTQTTQRVTDVVSLLDTAPTILDVLGLPPHAEHQGTSMLRPGPRMALFFTDYSRGWLGLRDGCVKYVLETNSGRSKLFDVCADANESVDLAATAPDRIRVYRDRVEEWSAAQKTLIKNGVGH